MCVEGQLYHTGTTEAALVVTNCLCVQGQWSDTAHARRAPCALASEAGHVDVAFVNAAAAATAGSSSSSSGSRCGRVSVVEPTTTSERGNERTSERANDAKEQQTTTQER